MWNAIGVIEVTNFSNTVVVMDAVLKAADVEIVSFHKTLGGKMVRGVVAGNVSGVEASMEAAELSRELIGEENLKVAVCISNPHPEVVKLMNLLNKQETEKEN